MLRNEDLHAIEASLKRDNKKDAKALLEEVRRLRSSLWRAATTLEELVLHQALELGVANATALADAERFQRQARGDWSD